MSSSTICLNKQAIESVGLSLGETLLLLAIHNNIDLIQAEESLIKRGFITAERGPSYEAIGWRVTRTGGEILDAAIIESEPSSKDTTEERYNALARKLKEIYPKGKKEGTNSYWAEGETLIVRRLKIFFKKYGTDYTDEQIINATKAYVSSFNGDYQFMRVLKYFIFKEVKGDGGNIEGTSDLYNVMTHAEEDNEVINNNWRDSVR